MTLEKYILENSNKYTSFKNLTYDDLYNIAEWGLTEKDFSSGVWDETDDLNEAIKLIINSFKEQLNIKFPEGLKDFPDHVVTLYRYLSLKDKKDLKTKDLGQSWFANPDRIGDSRFFQQLDHLKGNENRFLLMVECPVKNIDISMTLWSRDLNYWENEIVLYNSIGCKIIKIEKT